MATSLTAFLLLLYRRSSIKPTVYPINGFCIIRQAKSIQLRNVTRVEAALGVVLYLDKVSCIFPMLAVRIGSSGCGPQASRHSRR
jgi:hypothetical protein